ncbi:NAD(P)/FAD-dependent oxidoreductase [Nocardiopsis ansamitocini]|uniref:FAD dependent oxidoreductase domain-containing protein n=1 Tax=Nocardiopsis ansamitocini TaxID=1670832 RepID=A0A9W6UL65_9ACTN|nr:FAD-binding oxidoreductase [Nocardiopsis ansamitocini]GLU49775.1 hypothetical protein Nans01_41260 [Nocardiopsis ansamitocini]
MLFHGPPNELSWWLDQATPGAEPDAPSLTETISADVCIVGGGYTGLWTALRIKAVDPSADVALIEAQTCGSGASGRNGGFMLSWWPKLATLIKLFGTDEGVRLAAASTRSILEIGAFCEENGIDAHYRRDGWLWAATNQAQIGAWDEAVRVSGEHGYTPFAAWDSATVAETAGSPTHVGGVFERDAATVQPALLARGLRRVAIERGVRIYEHSPMTGWQDGSTVVVRTPHGSVRADKVVLATNAWMTREPRIAKALIVVTSDMVVTDPLPPELSHVGPRGGIGVSDSRMLVNYYHTTADGRLAFGHGGGNFGFGRRVGKQFNGASARAEAVTKTMVQLYPELSRDAVVRSWTGPIDRSISSLPFFGQLGRTGRVLYGVGFSGNGVGPSHLAGKILASRALGLDDEWGSGRIAKGPVGTYPPEPFKYIGGTTIGAVLEHKEKLEDQGRAPGPVTRALSKLAPPGLVPVRVNSKPDSVPNP